LLLCAISRFPFAIRLSIPLRDTKCDSTLATEEQSLDHPDCPQKLGSSPHERKSLGIREVMQVPRRLYQYPASSSTILLRTLKQRPFANHPSDRLQLHLPKPQSRALLSPLQILRKIYSNTPERRLQKPVIPTNPNPSIDQKDQKTNIFTTQNNNAFRITSPTNIPPTQRINLVLLLHLPPQPTIHTLYFCPSIRLPRRQHRGIPLLLSRKAKSHRPLHSPDTQSWVQSQ